MLLSKLKQWAQKEKHYVSDGSLRAHLMPESSSPHWRRAWWENCCQSHHIISSQNCLSQQYRRENERKWLGQYCECDISDWRRWLEARWAVIGHPFAVISDLKLENRFKVSIDVSLALSLSLSLSLVVEKMKQSSQALTQLQQNDHKEEISCRTHTHTHNTLQLLRKVLPQWQYTYIMMNHKLF